MIHPDILVMIVIGYLAFNGIASIILSLCRTEKPTRSHYGITEGVAGLILLAAAVLMVVL